MILGNHPLLLIFIIQDKNHFKFVGDHDQFQTTETEAIQRAVSAIIRHRNFDQNTYNHDIALLRLRKPVTFTKSIQPICLPRESIDPSGKIATVIGYLKLI